MTPAEQEALKRATEAALETTVKLKEVQDLFHGLEAMASDGNADLIPLALDAWMDERIQSALQVKPDLRDRPMPQLPLFKLEDWKR